MVTNKLKSILLTAALLAPALSYAIPARPGLLTTTLPDGSTLRVELRGDERSHFYLSEDGYLLTEEDGYLYYGALDAQGEIVSSSIRAVDIERRDAAATSYLQSVEMERVYEALERRANLASTMSRAAGPGLDPEATFPCIGEQKALVILVDYADRKFNLEDPYAYFSELLGGDDFTQYGATGSVKQYYLDCSKGAFILDCDLYGPVTMSRNASYYGSNDMWGNDKNPQEMVREACEYLDDEVDFTQYDRDGDGVIDNVYVFYAGLGEASGGGASTIWPHSWDVREAGLDVSFDGKTLGHYACSNEWYDGKPDGIGTFCHEFSHVLGLPDLYSTTYTSAFTPGSWEIMDRGSYNNNSRTPPQHCVFSQYALGWVDPKDITKTPRDYTLAPLAENEAYVIRTSKNNEFFLLENRQQTGWDTYIPGHGMLIWHVDYNEGVWNRNVVNNTSGHQYVDIEEADGLKTESTRAGDAFPGTENITLFTDDTWPNMLTWSKKPMEMPISNIAESEDGIISFSVCKYSKLEAVPEAIEATNIWPFGFTANWTPLEGATNYYLYVYAAADPNHYLVSGVDTGTETSYEVTGLEPGVDYCYSLTARLPEGLTLFSNEIGVTTSSSGFELSSPTIMEPVEVTSDAFTLRWEALEEAQDYILNLYTKEMTGNLSDACNFDDGIESLPEGWTTTASSDYFNSAYAGLAAPSLLLREDGQYLRTREYDSPISSISFWMRGHALTPDARLLVRYMNEEEWVDIETLEIPSKEGNRFEIGMIPEEAHQLYLYFDCPSYVGRVAIDDVEVLYDNVEVEVPYLDYTDLHTGDVTQYRVEGLLPATTYYYTLRGHNGKNQSLASEEAAVTTSEYTGVGETVADGTYRVDGKEITFLRDASVSIATIDGILLQRGDVKAGARVSLPASGVYVLTLDGKSLRLLIK